MTDGSFVRHRRRRVANVTTTILRCLRWSASSEGSGWLCRGPGRAPRILRQYRQQLHNRTPSNDFRWRACACRAGRSPSAAPDGYIAVVCSVDNPRVAGTVLSRWNQLQVTYRDPDGMGLPGQQGSNTGRMSSSCVSKTTGTWEKITSFDSNLQCAGGPASAGRQHYQNYGELQPRSTSTTTPTPSTGSSIARWPPSA